MLQRKPMDGIATMLMLVLCSIWAMQQIVLKATANEFAPVFQIAVRNGVGGLLVLLFILVYDRSPKGPALRLWRPGLIVGSLFALEFLLVGESLRFTSAGHVVVLLYTAPIFAALGLHIKLMDERLSAFQWFGVLVAFVGVAIAFLIRDPEMANAQGPFTLWGDLLALLAGAAWGATTVVVRITPMSELPASHTLLYQLAIGSILLFLATVILGQTEFQMTPMVWVSLSFQSIFVGFISYLTWFWLLRKYLASRLGVFSFLTPIIGVLLGAWLLDEPIGGGFLIGTMLVITGVVLISGYGWFAKLFKRPGRS